MTPLKTPSRDWQTPKGGTLRAGVSLTPVSRALPGMTPGLLSTVFGTRRGTVSAALRQQRPPPVQTDARRTPGTAPQGVLET